VGPWERKSKTITFENGGPTIPVEYNSVPARVLAKTNLMAVNDDLILGELDNAVRYFANIFGPYPYESFSGAFTPFNFGQSAATLLMIPPATKGRESNVYQFFSHETAHQWWGHVVLWKSYRDQWLSEGFAEYSSTLYAALRTGDANKTVGELVRDMRQQLLEMPGTLGGVGKGRLNDIGPIVLGHRLLTLKTLGAYQALIYSKGALVLRMLQFLLSNPSNGDNAEFLATMKDFVTQHREGSASTEDFWNVASLHFARTPIAAKFSLQNLDWFFKEWVYGTGLPSYQLDYETVAQDGSLMLKGTVKQTNVDPDFQMVLPLVMTFEGNQQARTSVRALGLNSTFELKVPQKPIKVELDPFNWVLSEKTTSKGK
jgi:aminopeptidase N